MSSSNKEESNNATTNNNANANATATATATATTTPTLLLSKVVNPFVEVLDVDGIIQRIEINDLLDKVDFNKVCDRIEWNDICGRINWNEVCHQVNWNDVINAINLDETLERVDLDAILARIDLVELCERAEIPAIVTRSTSSVFSSLFDSMRIQFVLLDQFVQGNGWIRRKTHMPLAPGIDYKKAVLSGRGATPKLPKDKSQIPLAVQGHHAGFASRVIAFAFDLAIIVSIFSLCVWLLDRIVTLARTAGEVSDNNDNDKFSLKEIWGYWILLAQFIFAYLYFASGIAASSKTIGKAVIGLKVVNAEDGTHVSVERVLIRSIFVTADIFCFFGWITIDKHYMWFASWVMLEIIVGLCRRDRKQLHDVIARTSVVYSWDAKLAQYRQQLEEEESEIVRNITQIDLSLDTSSAQATSDIGEGGESGGRTRGGLLRRRKPRFWPRKKTPTGLQQDSSRHVVFNDDVNNSSNNNNNSNNNNEKVRKVDMSGAVHNISDNNNNIIINVNEFISARQVQTQKDIDDDPLNNIDRSLEFISAREIQAEEEGDQDNDLLHKMMKRSSSSSSSSSSPPSPTEVEVGGSYGTSDV